MKIKKLLYATDIEKQTFPELERLMVLRKVGLEEVIFLHPGEGQDQDNRVAEYGLKSKNLVIEGPLLSGILHTARQEEASIIAVCLKRDASKVTRGSVIKNLLRSSPVPVIVLNEDARMSGPIEKGLFHHVVYATDWSPVSEKALRALLKLKEIIGMLEIVNVINKKLSIRDMRDLKERLVKTRKLFLDNGIDTETHVYAGKPSEEIMLAAEDYDATSIIMGTSCKSFFKEILSGSCAYSVAKEAVVPVLVINH